MIKLSRDTIRAIFEISLLVPMPWRVGLVILIVALLLYFLVWRLLPALIEKLTRLFLFLSEGIAALLLLPEYLITKQLRRFGHQPLPGTYVFGDILQGIVGLIHAATIKLTGVLQKKWRLSKRWVVLIVFLVTTLILLWYMRPVLDETVAGTYIDQGTAWWHSLEGWALTGEWGSPSQAAPVIKPETATSTPSGDTVTPTPPVGAVTPAQANTPRATFTLTPRPTRSPTATPVHTVYVVQPGDSLSKIAKDFGVSVEDLVATNKVRYPSLVTDPASIKAGWKLLIPEQR